MLPLLLSLSLLLICHFHPAQPNLSTQELLRGINAGFSGASSIASAVTGTGKGTSDAGTKNMFKRMIGF